MAFGGVETGSIIAKDALKVTAMTTMVLESLESVVVIAMTIGRMIFVAAVLLIKFEIKSTI